MAIENLSQRLSEIKGLEEKAGEHIKNRDYWKAYEDYYRAAVKARDFGLIRMYHNYMVLAGNAVYEEGGWLNYQRAADCYAAVGESELIEKMLKELNYNEEDITPGTWMGMARALAEINRKRYFRWE